LLNLSAAFPWAPRPSCLVKNHVWALHRENIRCMLYSSGRQFLCDVSTHTSKIALSIGFEISSHSNDQPTFRAQVLLIDFEWLLVRVIGRIQRFHHLHRTVCKSHHFKVKTSYCAHTAKNFRTLITTFSDTPAASNFGVSKPLKSGCLKYQLHSTNGACRHYQLSIIGVSRHY